MAATPEMFYFPIAGRGEVSRMVCAAGGQDLSDSFSGLGFAKQPWCLFGSMPVLVHDGIIIAQSGAVEKYLANITPGFAGLTPEQRAVDNFFAATKEDMMQAALRVAMPNKGDDMPAALVNFTEKWDLFLGGLEQMVPSTGFINGLDFPTMADLVLLSIAVSEFCFGKAQKQAQYDWKKFSNIQANVERTSQAPGVKEYLKSGASVKMALPSCGFICRALTATVCGCWKRRNQKSARALVQPIAKAGGAASAASPELFYFPMAGRGELSRLIAASGNLTITETFPGSDYKVDKDKVGLFGSLPTLKHGDLYIAQSSAIETYLATIAPLYKDLTPKQRAIDDMLIHTKEDILAPCAKIWFGDEEGKAKAAETLTAVFHRFLGPVEKDVVPNSGFINGCDFPTAADLVLVNVHEATMPIGNACDCGKIDRKEMFAKEFPKIAALIQRTMAVPNVKAYLKSSTSMKKTLTE